MNLKSYLYERAPIFNESKIAPIHLADLDGRHYYAFAKNVIPPSGGKNVSDAELNNVIANCQIIQQIKQETKRRITNLAPEWKQQNALIDLYQLNERSSLTEQEQKKLASIQTLLKEISRLRSLSNTFELSFLEGIAVNYNADIAWEHKDA